MKKLAFITYTTCFIIYATSVFALSYNQEILNKISNIENSDNFEFVVMGDNKDGDHVLKKIISQINQNYNTKFALNNGDLVPDGYENEYLNYLKIIKTSKRPIISIIGNHEIPWYGGENNYKKIFGKTYFSFIFGNSYFIILDDSDEEGIFDGQYKWLENELEISKKYQNRFIFMHLPLYDPRVGEYKKGHSLENTKNVKKLNELFDKYHVSMLFCSHIHSYFRGFWHKTPYIITGGAGASLKGNGFYHYIKVIVSGKNITYTVIKVDAKPLSMIENMIQSIKDTLNLY